MCHGVLKTTAKLFGSFTDNTPDVMFVHTITIKQIDLVSLNPTLLGKPSFISKKLLHDTGILFK